jgi:peptide/nickel transport system substrate-binding protein
VNDKDFNTLLAEMKRLAAAVERLAGPRPADNDFDVADWVANGGANADILINPVFFVPLSSLSSHALLYAKWRQSGGTQGEEPTGDMRTVSDLYDQILVTADPAKQDELMRQILEINKKNFWVMGVVRPPLGIGITKQNFRNVAPQLLDVTATGGYGPTRPEQYFWKK